MPAVVVVVFNIDDDDDDSGDDDDEGGDDDVNDDSCCGYDSNIYVCGSRDSWLKEPWTCGRKFASSSPGRSSQSIFFLRVNFPY